MTLTDRALLRYTERNDTSPCIFMEYMQCWACLLVWKILSLNLNFFGQQNGNCWTSTWFTPKLQDKCPLWNVYSCKACLYYIHKQSRYFIGLKAHFCCFELLWITIERELNYLHGLSNLIYIYFYFIQSL